MQLEPALCGRTACEMEAQVTVGPKDSPNPGPVKRAVQMPPPELLKSLETLAGQLNVALRYEEGEFQGGLCRVRGRNMIILPLAAPVEEKIERLASGLANFDMDKVYVRPLIRDLLDRVRDKEA